MGWRMTDTPHLTIRNPEGLTFLSGDGMDAAQVAYQQYVGDDAQVDLALMATIIKTYARVTQKETRLQEQKLREQLSKKDRELTCNRENVKRLKDKIKALQGRKKLPRAVDHHND